MRTSPTTVRTSRPCRSRRSMILALKALDIRFHAMLSQLLTRPVWQRADFDSLARELKLMPDGALDAVNTWAYERFDDPIIVEQGEELQVQSHLVESSAMSTSIKAAGTGRDPSIVAGRGRSPSRAASPSGRSSRRGRRGAG